MSLVMTEPWFLASFGLVLQNFDTYKILRFEKENKNVKLITFSLILG